MIIGLCGQQRKSCFPDVDRCVGISVKDRATAVTDPPAVRQCQIGIDGSADVAGFAAGQPTINLYNDTAVLAGDPLQDLDELSVRKVGYLSTPQAFHSIQVQVLDANDSVLAYQFIRQLEKPIPPAVAYPRMDAFQIS